MEQFIYEPKKQMFVQRSFSLKPTEHLIEVSGLSRGQTIGDRKTLQEKTSKTPIFLGFSRKTNNFLQKNMVVLFFPSGFSRC